MPALSPNSFIVVTGISGYIGSHVGLAALKAGHRVRGTVRSLDRGELIKAAYAKEGIADLDSRLEIVVLDDLLSTDQYRRALKGADGVAHIAADLSKIMDVSIVDDLVTATSSLLNAAKDEPSIKRIVIASSSEAAISPPAYRDRVLTDQDWNEEAIQVAERDPNKAAGIQLYGYGKVKVERIAFSFVQNEKPQFDLATTLLVTNMGPALHGMKPTSTGTILGDFLKNERGFASLLPSQGYIDVRDAGRMHVLALTTPKLGGRRIWCFANPFGWNNILAILRKNYPQTKVPDDFEGIHGEVSRQWVDNSLATEALGGWIPLEQSILDQAKSLGY